VNDNLRNTGIIVIQSFTIFVALSTLLGRMYFLTYYEALGIPHSEIRLGAIDYSIVSPDVTVFGIGISLLFVFHLWTHNTPVIPSLNRWFDYSISQLSWVISGLLIGSFFFVVERGSSWTSGFPGFFGAWLLLPFVLFFVGSREFANYTEYMNTSSKIGQAIYRASTVLGAFLRVFLIVLLAVYCFISGPLFGQLDARMTLQSSPEVVVNLTSPPIDSQPETNYGQANQCFEDPDYYMFRVVLTTQSFVYLQSVDSDSSSGKPSLHAIPVDTICRIVFLPRND